MLRAVDNRWCHTAPRRARRRGEEVEQRATKDAKGRIEQKATKERLGDLMAMSALPWPFAISDARGVRCAKAGKNGGRFQTT